jgi:hypothetical protein
MHRASVRTLAFEDVGQFVVPRRDGRFVLTIDRVRNLSTCPTRGAFPALDGDAVLTAQEEEVPAIAQEAIGRDTRANQREALGFLGAISDGARGGLGCLRRRHPLPLLALPLCALPRHVASGEGPILPTHDALRISASSTVA